MIESLQHWPRRGNDPSAPRHAIGLGGQKCASSWVHAVLAAHPEVAAHPAKELDFFSYRHDRGHAWYRAQWRGPGVRFECSPSYLHDPRSPRRLAAFAPDARLILTLRDPVERAYSHHLHEIARGHIPAQSFGRALADNPDYIEQGLYARHLAAWREAFPARSILVLLSEEIAADPEGARRRLLGHLGLSPGPSPPMVVERRNVSDRPRSAALRRVLRAGGAAMRAAGAERGLCAVKRAPGIAALRRWNDRPLRDQVPPLTEVERRSLTALFADDLAALPALLGRETLPWKSWRLACHPPPLERML